MDFSPTPPGKRSLAKALSTIGTRAVLLTLVLSTGRGPAAWAQEAVPKPVSDSLVAVVQRFFEAMGKQDTTTLRTLLVPEGHAFGVFWRGDSIETSVTAHREFLTHISRAKQRWRERMWKPRVLRHGPLAVVWGPYDFHLDAKFSHCGVDSFTLLRGREGWRIADVAFTMEPEGCAPSPLGPLR